MQLRVTPLLRELLVVAKGQLVVNRSGHVSRLRGRTLVQSLRWLPPRAASRSAARVPCAGR